MTKLLSHPKLQVSGFALTAIVIGTVSIHAHSARASLNSPLLARGIPMMDDMRADTNDARNFALVPAGRQRVSAPLMLHHWAAPSQARHALGSTAQPGLFGGHTIASKLVDATPDVLHHWPIPPQLVTDATPDVLHHWPIPPQLVTDATPDVLHHWPIPPQLVTDATPDVLHHWPIPPQLVADATPDVLHHWPIPPQLATNATPDVLHHWPIPPQLA